MEVICDNFSGSDIVATDTGSKMMFFPALPSSHCVQQGKPDSSRFKTANEMSSENSSSSNSDPENLNSVPTNRKNSVQLPASYPSQISSAPQASYADVIRTPAAAVSKIHPPQGVNSVFTENSKCSENNSVQPPLENISAEKLQKREEAHPMGSSEWIISRLSQLDVNTNAALNVNGVSPHSTPNGLDFVNPQPIAVSLEKPSFYHSGLQTNKNAPYSVSLSPVNLCSPNKINNENRGLTDSNAEKLPTNKANEKMAASSHSVIGLGELSNQKLEGTVNGRTDSLSSNPSSMSSSICDAFKYPSSSNGDSVDSKSKQQPVVIMDNFMPLENTSGISFGIDYDEVIKLCSDSDVLSNSVPFCEHPPVQDMDKTSAYNDSCSKTAESTEKQCVCVAGSDKCVCDEQLCKKRAIVKCSRSTSRVIVAGKNLFWRDVEVNNQACDITSLVGFLSESWNTIEKSLKKGSSNPDAKIKYFEPEHL